MPERSLDWMRQAEADLRHAKNSLDAGDHDWACFAAHQAAEKAVKAVFQKLHLDAWGHTVSVLLANLPAPIKVDEAEAAIRMAGEIVEFCKDCLR
ncbi:MAG: HEPN domain-containing protein [Moorellales bacterium]